MGNKHTLTVEQIIAFYLTRLKKFYEQAEIVSKDIVISVPSYCSNVERQSILDAAEIETCTLPMDGFEVNVAL